MLTLFAVKIIYFRNVGKEMGKVRVLLHYFISYGILYKFCNFSVLNNLHDNHFPYYIFD